MVFPNMSKQSSKYQNDFEYFFHERMDYKILADPYQYEYVKAILKPAEEMQAVFCDAPAGSGKALKNGSLVQTPKGPTAIESLKIGERVFGPDGKDYPVKGVFPQGKKEVYEVHFSDGTVVECCDEHLWTFQTKRQRDEKTGYQTKTLREIIDDFPLTKASGKWKARNIYLPPIEPVLYGEKDFFISPYLLGTLIGDGQLGRVSFSNSEKDILKKVSSEIEKLGYKFSDSDSKDHRIIMSKDTLEKFHDNEFTTKGKTNPLKKELKSLGLLDSLSETKFIPRSYLESSVKQRIELLNGLIDTDGSVNGSSYEYTTSSEQLSLDIKELCHSLGLTVSISVKEKPTYQYKGELLIGKPSYRLRIKSSELIPKIHTSEKHEARWKKGQSSARITIRDIVKTGRTEEMTCISIDSPDHLFLTENFIPTHNTAIALTAAYYMLQKGWISKIVYVRNTVSLRENGFLPGTPEEKEEIFMRPLFESINRIGLKDRRQDLYEDMVARGELVATSTSYLRGTDISGDALIIVDEAQNLSLGELRTVLTRKHDSVKAIVIGSHLQVDTPEIQRFGKKGILPFELFMAHFDENKQIPTTRIELKENYRGKFAQYTDSVHDTIKKFDEEEERHRKQIKYENMFLANRAKEFSVSAETEDRLLYETEYIIGNTKKEEVETEEIEEVEIEEVEELHPATAYLEAWD